ncbi:HNH endonuclease [Streptomyces sp. KL116D]|uniref:HNH endonuclease n=1 Tax=Streptomyces sp. KL116D TaxID=3045152 RepID=UPI003556092A
MRRAIAAQYKAARRTWERRNPDSVGIVPREWRKLVRRYRNRCAYCGGNEGGIHMDHVIPLSRGGRHAIGNVLPACQGCNLSKGSKLVAEWKRDEAAWSPDAKQPPKMQLLLSA